MSDGEVLLGEYMIYCRLGGRLTEIPYFHDKEADDNKIIFMPPHEWTMPNKRKISPHDRDDICVIIQKHLTLMGYDCSFD